MQLSNTHICYIYDAKKNNLADVASDIQLNATVTLIIDICLTSCRFDY